MGGLVPKQSNGQNQGAGDAPGSNGGGAKRSTDQNSDSDVEPKVKLGRFDKSTSDSESDSESSRTDMSTSESSHTGMSSSDSISSLDSVPSLSKASADSSPRSELSSISDPSPPSESESSADASGTDGDDQAASPSCIHSSSNVVVINSSSNITETDYRSNSGYLALAGNIVTWRSDRVIVVQTRSGGRYLIPNTGCTSFQLSSQENSFRITMNGIQITVQPRNGLETVGVRLSPEGRMEIRLPQ